MRYIILELALDETILGLVRTLDGEILVWETEKDAKSYAKEQLAFDYRIVKI